MNKVIIIDYYYRKSVADRGRGEGESKEKRLKLSIKNYYKKLPDLPIRPCNILIGPLIGS